MKTIVSILMISLMMTTMLSPGALARGDIDRTKRPSPKPAPKVHLPEIQKTTIANGLQVWLVEHHELPTVAFNLVVQAGADHDPLTMPGLAAMTADVIDEGTATRNALQISDELESLGAFFSTNAGWDGSFMTLNVLSKYMAKALAIYADVLTNPVFPEKEFQRLRKQRVTALLQQRDRPPVIASNAFAAILYGPQHPYGNNMSGTEASLQAMKVDDLRRFYTTYYRPNNATLVVVGDVTMGEIKGMLEEALAGWHRGDVPAAAIPEPKPIAERTVYLIDKPGAAQSEIRVGYPALARSTPDFFPVTVMNRLLGGQFTSRINLNLREKHGYTYGARSSFSFQKGAGPFTAQAPVVTEKTDSALHECLYELELMHDKGMTSDELEFVKKGLVGNFALNFETPSQIAGALQNIVLYGLPDDYYQNYLQTIDAVSLADVNRVAKQYLDTSRMAVVVVGDLAKIKSGIAALNLGRMVECDLTGKPR